MLGILFVALLTYIIDFILLSFIFAWLSFLHSGVTAPLLLFLLIVVFFVIDDLCMFSVSALVLLFLLLVLVTVVVLVPLFHPVGCSLLLFEGNLC